MEMFTIYVSHHPVFLDGSEYNCSMYGRYKSIKKAESDLKNTGWKWKDSQDCWNIYIGINDLYAKVFKINEAEIESKDLLPKKAKA